MVKILLGQQAGFTKYPCFLCMWNFLCWDRAQHYTKRDWPGRNDLEPSIATNIINKPLVDREKILYPPPHIKLGLMKQYTKALDFEGSCFRYLCQVFPGLSMGKLKAGIFDGPQIRQLIRDPEFEESMNTLELEAWNAFVLVIKNFVGN